VFTQPEYLAQTPLKAVSFHGGAQLSAGNKAEPAGLKLIRPASYINENRRMRELPAGFKYSFEIMLQMKLLFAAE